jgi:diguanylate cyclase (GGDEF)-like protein/putative nucleotidyltransferase with HDIG domain
MGYLPSCSSPVFILPIVTTFLLVVFLLHWKKRSAAQRRRSEEQIRHFSNLQMQVAGIVAAAEPKKFVAETLDGILRALNLERGQALLLVPRTLDSDFCAVRGFSDQLPAEIGRGPMREYLATAAERWGSMIVFQDLLRRDLDSDRPRDALFPQFRETFSAAGARTLAVAGLCTNEKSHGVLVLGSREARSFSPEELRVALSIGNQLAVALENRSLHKTAERYDDDLRVLHRVVESLNSTIDLQVQMQTLQKELKNFLGAGRLSLVLRDSPDDHYMCVQGIPPAPGEAVRSGEAVEGLAQYVLTNDVPLLIAQDFLTTVRRLGVSPIDPRIMSWGGVPIHFRDGSTGVLVVTDYEREGTISGRHFGLLKILAGEIAVAIENARLFQQEQRRASHLMILHEMTRKATAILDPHEMLATICRDLRESFGLDLARVETLDKEKEELVVEAYDGYVPDVAGRRTKVGQGFAGLVAESHEPFLSGDVLASDKYLPFHPGVRSGLYIPMKYRDELLGVLTMESLRPKAFSHQDMLTLRTLADELAVALKNALAYQVAQEQAITDSLTNLKTHRFFMEALDAEWRRSPRSGRPFSIIVLDLDGFKQVNERQGHLEGDKVLNAVARAIEARCRQSNVVARYGGDQFAVLMPDASAEQAEILAERLRVSLAADAYLSPRNVTASLGIATFPVHGVTPEEIVRVAESGMYLAKHEKGNRVRVAGGSAEPPAAGWEQHLLQAYLGVAVKRMFSTGPDVFNQYLSRFEAATREDNPSLMDTVTALAFTIDAKDHYTQGHSQSVSRLAAQIGQQLGLTKDELEEIRLAGILHDIGKIGVPESVLNKPSCLTPEEYELVKSHTTLGERILAPLKVKAIEHIRKMVRSHHERVDGKGYPDGLLGEDIPLGARIITIADCYDTLISDRSYKKACPLQEAVEELQRGRGTQFDTKLLDAFLQSLTSAGAPKRSPMSWSEVN